METLMTSPSLSFLLMLATASRRWSMRGLSSRASSSRDLSFRASSSRDHADAVLCSANVPRPAASSRMELHRARHRPDLADVMGLQLSSPHHARCPGAWGEWRSEIKGERVARRTFAESFIPSARAYKNTNNLNHTNQAQARARAQANAQPRNVMTPNACHQQP